MSRPALRLLLLSALALLPAAPAWAAGLAEVRLAEVRLAEVLDEPRGYCLDLVGSQARADPRRSLQVHTCYAYRGAIGVDQGVVADLAERGIFRFASFGVCLQRPQASGPAVLAPCTDDDGPLLLWSGQRIQDADGPAALCLTAGGGAGEPGGGGNPVHLRRALAWEPCRSAGTGPRAWTLRTDAAPPNRAGP